MVLKACRAHEFQFYQANKEKFNKISQKRERQETREKKKSLRTLTDRENAAKREFQKWVRNRDAKLPCISCDKFANRYDGGHYLDAGMYSGLIFHEDNTNKQCSSFCNKHQHGNKINYRTGLVKKIGEARVLWLEENKDRLRDLKYTREELETIRIKYRDLNKQFK